MAQDKVYGSLLRRRQFPWHLRVFYTDDYPPENQNALYEEFPKYQIQCILCFFVIYCKLILQLLNPARTNGSWKTKYMCFSTLMKTLFKKTKTKRMVGGAETLLTHFISSVLRWSSTHDQAAFTLALNSLKQEIGESGAEFLACKCYCNETGEVGELFWMRQITCLIRPNQGTGSSMYNKLGMKFYWGYRTFWVWIHFLLPTLLIISTSTTKVIHLTRES